MGVTWLLVSAFAVAQAPANDACSAAIVLTETSVITGDLTGATSDQALQDCVSLPNEDGVWYKISPTSDKQLIFLIGTDLQEDDYQLSLFSGPDCDNLTCELDYSGFDPNYINNTLLAWDATAGNDYYLHVAQVAGGSAPNEFELRVEILDYQVNDDCSGAIAVTEGSYSVTLKGSTHTDDYDSCGSAYESDSPDIYYTFTPTESGSYSATVVSVFGQLEKLVTVYSGDCENLTCINGGSYNGGQYYDATAEWDATAGTKYTILLHADAADGYGNFVFTLEQNPPTTNDDCASATVITPGSYRGSTATATPTENIDCDDLGEGNDHWYAFTAPDNAEYNITTNSLYTTFDTQLILLSGDCANPTCEDDNDDYGNNYYSRIDFTATQGVTYYFVVIPFDEDVSGNYELTLNRAEVPMNDDCASASDITYNSTVRGSTFGATASAALTDCEDADDNDAPDAWYRFQPTTSGTAVASLVDQFTDYYTALTVYEGTDCNSLTCIAGVEEVFSIVEFSELSFDFTEGTTYYIVVHGEDDDEFGNYQLYLGEPIDRNQPQTLPNTTSGPVLVMETGRYYSTISAAVAAVPEGVARTIIVESGTYPETVNFGTKLIQLKIVEASPPAGN
ncbi:hypothetical protein A3850_015195 [Lewinella sp. 4G2]|nr:hypothetical protein A3850_015195 [Lewinella sp. 4G2]